MTLFCGPIEILKTFKLYPLLGKLSRLAFPVDQYQLSQINPDSVACSSLNVNGRTLAVSVGRGTHGSLHKVNIDRRLPWVSIDLRKISVFDNFI